MNLYFECNMGAAGDMLAAALTDLFEDKTAVIDELNALSLPHTVVEYEKGESNSISASHIHIVIDGEEEKPDGEGHHHHHHHHHGRSLSDICGIIDKLSAPEKVKADAKEVYKIIAEAEAKAHNKPAGEVHFHELGMLDAVADVTICAYLINKLNPERISCSPINVGSGTVKCAHGIMPVPAPATANILEGVPYYKSEIQSELCTPTGAAVLKYFADEFTDSPSFENVLRVGLGMGTKKFERANIVRAFLSEGESSVTEYSCNVDDMTGEEIAFAAEQIMNAGALDCFVTPVFMKKGRPAYMLTVLCKNSEAESFRDLIFKHTMTLGIRKYTPSRYTLEREFIENSGVTIKRSSGYGTVKEKPEFEDIKALAIEKNISLFEAREQLKKDD